MDDESYRAWHPEDHVTFRWKQGEPWREGSIVYAEECIHGKLHKLTFVITTVVPNKLIEYIPLSRILRIYFPKNTFTMTGKGDGCIFTATALLKVGWLVKTFAGKKLEYGLSCVKQHMKEEGENLKRILEMEP